MGLRQLDEQVVEGINRAVHDQEWVTAPFEVITSIGGRVVLSAIAATAAVLAARRGRYRVAGFVVATSLLAQLGNGWLKDVVDRQRPTLDHPIVHAGGSSFPSGHAMATTVVLGAALIALLPLLDPAWRRRASLAAAATALLVGASRVLLGVHFVSDVIAGHVLGVLWLAAAASAFRVWPDIRRGPAA